jgi:hypothetical protein
MWEALMSTVDKTRSGFKQQRVVAVFLLFVAGIAGWFVPSWWTLRSATTRVVLLGIGLTLWYLIFEILSSTWLKRAFSVTRVLAVFGAAILFFSVAEVLSKSLLHGPLVPIAAAVAFVGVGLILLVRRLR